VAKEVADRGPTWRSLGYTRGHQQTGATCQWNNVVRVKKTLLGAERRAAADTGPHQCRARREVRWAAPGGLGPSRGLLSFFFFFYFVLLFSKLKFKFLVSIQTCDKFIPRLYCAIKITNLEIYLYIFFIFVCFSFLNSGIPF
jgi:hypothetical protein